MENQSQVAALARSNINILGISHHNDRCYVEFEFQWRDPRNNNHRWAKSIIILDDDSRIETELIKMVRQARSELEG